MQTYLYVSTCTCDVHVRTYTCDVHVHTYASNVHIHTYVRTPVAYTYLSTHVVCTYAHLWRARTCTCAAYEPPASVSVCFRDRNTKEWKLEINYRKSALQMLNSKFLKRYICACVHGTPRVDDWLSYVYRNTTHSPRIDCATTDCPAKEYIIRSKG